MGDITRSDKILLGSENPVSISLPLVKGEEENKQVKSQEKDNSSTNQQQNKSKDHTKLPTLSAVGISLTSQQAEEVPIKENTSDISQPAAAVPAVTSTLSSQSSIDMTATSVVQQQQETGRGNTSATSVPGEQAIRIKVLIALEDELGETKPVEIDEADEEPLAQKQNEENEDGSVNVCKRKVSITERVLRNKNSEQELALLQEEAEKRKEEMAALLNEHAQLVHEVETMQGDKENQRSATPTKMSTSPK